LVEHDEVDAAVLKELGELDQVIERAAKSVELGDDQLVASAVCRQQRLVQLRTARELPGDLVDEHLITAGCLERVDLGFGMLVAGGDAPIADPHEHIVYC
jgi:hypothetical protein